MFSHDDEEYIKSLLHQLFSEKHHEDKKEKSSDPNAKQGCKLSPSQLLIVAGFLSGVLEATSIVINTDQTIEIVLSGSLKRKSQLDKMMEQIGKMPFEEVIQSILDNQK